MGHSMGGYMVQKYLEMHMAVVFWTLRNIEIPQRQISPQHLFNLAAIGPTRGARPHRIQSPSERPPVPRHVIPHLARNPAQTQ